MKGLNTKYNGIINRKFKLFSILVILLIFSNSLGFGITASGAGVGVNIYEDLIIPYVPETPDSYVQLNVEITSIQDYPELRLKLANLGDAARTVEFYLDGALIDTFSTTSAEATNGVLISVHPSITSTGAYAFGINILNAGADWKIVYLKGDTFSGNPIIFKNLDFDRDNSLHLSVEALKITDYPEVQLKLSSSIDTTNPSMDVYINGEYLSTESTSTYNNKFSSLSLFPLVSNAESLYSITLKINSNNNVHGGWRLVSLIHETVFLSGLGAWQGYTPYTYLDVEFPVLRVNNPAPYPGQNTGSSSKIKFTYSSQTSTTYDFQVETGVEFKKKTELKGIVEKEWKLKLQFNLAIKRTESFSITESSEWLQENGVLYYLRADVIGQRFEFVGFNGLVGDITAAIFDLDFSTSSLNSQFLTPEVTQNDLSTYPTISQLIEAKGLLSGDIVFQRDSILSFGETRELTYEEVNGLNIVTGGSLTGSYAMSFLGGTLTGEVTVSLSKGTSWLNRKSISTSITTGFLPDSGGVTQFDMSTLLYYDQEGTPTLDFGITSYTIDSTIIRNELNNWSPRTYPSGKFNDFNQISTLYGIGWSVDTTGSNQYSYTFLGMSDVIATGSLGNLNIEGYFRLYDTFWSSLRPGRRYLRLYILDEGGTSILSSQLVINYNEGTDWLSKSIDLNLDPNTNYRIGIGRGDSWSSDWQLTAQWSSITYTTS